MLPADEGTRVAEHLAPLDARVVGQRVSEQLHQGL